MKTRERIIALLAAVLLVLCLAGCAMPVEYSTDTIVCEHGWGSGYGTIYDTYTTTITVYADNRVTLVTGPIIDQHIGLNVEEICRREYTITDAQRQELIEVMRRNRVNTIGDQSDYGVCDGGSSYIRLFDASGEEVYSCGGYAVTARRYDNVSNAIFALIPEGEIAEIIRESDALGEQLYNEAIDRLNEELDRALEESIEVQP